MVAMTTGERDERLAGAKAPATAVASGAVEPEATATSGAVASPQVPFLGIQARGVSKAFGPTQALAGLTATVPAGSVYGLVGPNGAGKTTLLGVLAAVLRPDAGQALLDGSPVWESPQAKARTSLVEAEPWLAPSATTDGMAQLHARLLPRFDVRRYARLARQLPLDCDRPTRELSRGQRRQAAFLLALSTAPDVLLMDEPMDGLDPLVRHAVWGMVMSEVAERGMTVVVSSHNLRELDGVCDRLGVMDHGAMVREHELGNPDDGLVRATVVLDEGVALPAGLDLVGDTAEGRLRTLVARGSAEGVREALAEAGLTPLDVRPLSLEELFMSELGGARDEHDNR